MRKWLYLIGAAAALAVLSRLPHPARDISKLDPVRAVYVSMEDGDLHIRTDTGDHGSGQTLTAAEADLRSSASGEIYLETAEFLILGPNVVVGEDFFTILHPDCRVCFTGEAPDLPAASDYLSTHTPTLRLAHLRAQPLP